MPAVHSLYFSLPSPTHRRVKYPAGTTLASCLGTTRSPAAVQLRQSDPGVAVAAQARQLDVSTPPGAIGQGGVGGGRPPPAPLDPSCPPPQPLSSSFLLRASYLATP